jgi:3-deoxy-7-phosphoheptulonate synthase
MDSNNGILDLNIAGYSPMSSFYQIALDLPMTEDKSRIVKSSRRNIENIIRSIDERMLFIVGPCSISDPESALEYAIKLSKLSKKVDSKIVLVMRTYFEKPRTTVGWTGLINDPDLNGTKDINKGLRLSRFILLQILGRDISCATEYLDPFIPQYNSDLISWAAIGARTVESPIHRQLASGLSMPVGFKNGTSGRVDVAVNAILSAREPQNFPGIDMYNTPSTVHTKGNKCTHLVMRGGLKPNYSSIHIKKAQELLHKASISVENGINETIMVDCSHANSQKDYTRQAIVFQEIMKQRIGGTKRKGNKNLIGIMMESHLYEGSITIPNNLTNFDKSILKYGVSVTDACLGWDDTKHLILDAYKSLH